MSVWLTGDSHGELQMRRLSNVAWPEGKTLTKQDYVIILGDFGLLFNNVQTASEKYWLNWLDERPFTTLFVAGNHENHPLLEQLPSVPMFGGTVGKVNDSVFHLRNGEIYEIEGKKYFVMGGAASTDKQWRIDGVNWWAGEIPDYATMQYGIDNLAKHNNTVDIILAHTLPATVAKIYLNSLGLGDYFPCPVSNYLDNIITNTSFYQFYCGHWHMNWNFGKYSVLYENIIKVPIDFTA